MNRREWLKLGGAGVATTSMGLWSPGALAQTVCNTCAIGPAGAAVKTFDLVIGDLTVRMVDGEMLNMLGFGLADGVARVPGPVLRVKEGQLVSVKILNTRQETHGFEITGLPDTKTEIAPGCSCTVNFVAPVGGTYIYHDAFGDSPLYRILGLHGIVVVEPANGLTQQAAITPYSLDKLTQAQAENISKVFNAMGMTDRFLGGEAGRWVPATETEEFGTQEKVWVISEHDPRFNALVVPGQQIGSDPSLTSNVVNSFIPRYFTLLNRSGFDLHTGDDVCPENYIGEPTLMRIANVGLAHHSLHTHGNHWLRLSQANLDSGEVEVADNIFEVDTWAMWPMDRRDLLLPFEVPPDMPYKGLVPADAGPTQFERMVAGTAQEPFPLRFVVHDHVEMGTTAAGGNYPQGMVTHWEIAGGLGGRATARASL